MNTNRIELRMDELKQANGGWGMDGLMTKIQFRAFNHTDNKGKRSKGECRRSLKPMKANRSLHLP